MKTSEKGIKLIETFEGFSAIPYPDVGGKNTVGYGHLIKDGEIFSSITEDQAAILLGADLLYAENAVNNAVLVTLNQNQFDALISFVFNLGAPNFRSSHLLAAINNSDFSTAAGEFCKWDHCNGVVVEGLLRRRLAESALFSS